MTLEGNLDDEYKEEFPFPPRPLATKVIMAACEALDFPHEPEVNLLLVSEEEMRGINLEQRGIGRSTDVLSFPIGEFNHDSGDYWLGDIVLCVPKMKEQAALYGHGEEREFAFLILHGVLHLFGFDHMEEEDTKVMEKLQEIILNQLKIER